MKHIIDALKLSKRKATHQRDNWKHRAMIYLAALKEIASGPCCGCCEPDDPMCYVGIAKDAIRIANSETVTKNPETTEDEARMRSENEPRPGSIWFDRKGEISDSVPATYLLLSADRRERDDRREWRAACFRDCSKEWMGAPVVILWDEDFKYLKYVGYLSIKHLEG